VAQMVITAVGQDRPGLVGEVTGQLLRDGINVSDSRMVNLRGQFAMLMLVEGSDDALARLKGTLPAVTGRLGLALSISEHGGLQKSVPGLPFRLKTYSMDQPGIVHRVSQMLQTHGVNIESLETRQESQPFGGGSLFTMDMLLTVPAGVSVKQLRAGLEVICESLNCDLDLEAA
jgi:glycine cleavage system transcriptional repressor